MSKKEKTRHLEELLASSLAQTDAQAKLLKGIITQQEFLENDRGERVGP